MEGFRIALMECGLHDLGFKGDRFTWWNNWEGSQFTKERLDRACANSDWLENFGGYLVTTAAASFSDHRPLVVSIAPEGQSLVRGERPFRYEASWALKEDCHKVVEEAWKRSWMVSNKLEMATEGLNRFKESLRTWSKTSVGSTNQQLHNKIQQLSALQQADKGELKGPIQVVKKDLDQLLEEDDIHWKQRAKQRWLQEGIEILNFSTSVIHRGEKRTIKTVADEFGSIAKSPEEVSAKFQHFFQNLFTTSNPEGISESLLHLERKVTEEMNEALLRKYTKQEVKKSAFVPGRLISDNIIVAFEALHTMNNKMTGKEGYMALKFDMSKAYDRIECVPIARGRIHINHLLFVDGSLLFCKANSLEWSRLLFVLSLYENVSGEHLNKEKTSIHFSRNTSHENKDLILRIAGALFEISRQKLSSNKVKMLSQAGKKIFIKSVVQSMATYSMTVFKLPWAFIKEINKLLRNYWWGQIEKEKKIH
ncbi:uncharacterized protein LOC121267125 [Juglans microcarpa x Juglans regia]|uniref:uncharacterized protein LOC121267125 n=1 Tax=Juglans microcarpa x Juglans regia TaxID=2249226 RepID=UPI001B7E080B|nr:uncharacterized protein LOC121267125 [Juglans microcarpa x Juglans regia]